VNSLPHQATIPAMRVRIINAVIIVSALASTCRATVEYSVSDLSALLPPLQFPPAAGGYAVAINNAGQVVVDTDNGYTFLYSGGSMTEIGGPAIGNAQAFYGNAINGAGVVVGSHNGQPFNYNGAVTGIPNTVNGGDAVGINSSGEIVGDFATTFNNSTVFSAFTYSGGTLTDFGGLDLNDPSDNTEANAVNSHGEVVGVIHGTPGGDIAGNPLGVVGTTGSTAFAMGNGQYHVVAGFLNSTGSCATGINDSGEFVGYFDTASETDAFLFNGSTYRDIGQISPFTNATAFLAINSNGEIISDRLNGFLGAYLDAGGGFVNLNTLIDPSSGWTLTVANGINDEGQIVG
jgi:probable HAF family extracellular repeat protein